MIRRGQSFSAVLYRPRSTTYARLQHVGPGFSLLTTICAVTACSPEISVQGVANAEVYIQSLCEEICSKYEECSPDPEMYGDCTLSHCTEEFLIDLDEPCFAERVELKRCWIERETCDEYFDVFLDTRPGSVCYDLAVVSHACIERQSSG
jgi:hypothetical protein